MGARCRCCAGHADRAHAAVARGGWRRPSSGPRLERDRHLVAAMRTNPDLPAPHHLAPILEAHRLIRTTDVFPAGQVLALIADGRRRVELHCPRLSPLTDKSSRRSTRAGFPPTMTPAGTSSKRTAWRRTTESRTR